MYMKYKKKKNDELYHFGVKGMKWGVRRYQNADGTLTPAGKKRQNKTTSRINSMYNRSNKWTNRKIQKLDKKGKTAKADVMREMVRRNEKARTEKIENVKNMSALEYKRSKTTDIKDAVFGGQRFMNRNKANMTTTLSRLNEYNIQRGMRWTSNFTLNSTLSRLSVSEGYDYLDRKNISLMSGNSGSPVTVQVYHNDNTDGMTW